MPRYVLNQANLGIEGLRHLPESWQHRVQIWNLPSNTSAKSRWPAPALMPRAPFRARTGRSVLHPDGSPWVHGKLFSLHPHNAYLHVWMELGAVGALLAAMVAAGLLGLILRLSHDARVQALGAAAATSFLVNASVSFGIWQSWFLATAVLGAFALVLVAGLVPAAPRPGDPA
jgi:hypothetical protein